MDDRKIWFGDMIARQVMVPRTDMITLDFDDTYASALKLFIRSGFSRIPVLGEKADEIVGIAYFKDVVEAIYLKSASEDDLITNILRKPMFVPETKLVDDLFNSMQAERQHIALLIDEYGGIAGLVTLEDMIEEIVGELDDEHDVNASQEIEPELNQSGEVMRCEVPARFAISDLEEIFGTQIEHEDIDTVLGLLTREIGRVAIRGSEADVSGLHLEATATSGRRRQVSKIEVTRV